MRFPQQKQIAMDVHFFAILLARDRGCEQSTGAERESLKPNMPTEMVEMMIIAVVVDVMLMLMLMMTLMMRATYS